MLCPSQPGGSNLVGAVKGAYGKGTYAANNGLGPMRETLAPDDLSLLANRQTGAFHLNSWLKISDIGDGSSNTAFVCELRVVRDQGDFRGVLHFKEGALYHHNYTPNSLVADAIRNGFCVTQPQAPCYGAWSGWRSTAMILTARSHHPGGVNLLLGDSSVRFVGETIALDVWQALSTPAAVQNEVVVSQF